MAKAHNYTHTTASGEVFHIPALSGDPSMAVQELLERIDAMRDVYARENDALSDADTQRFLVLQDEKLKIARFYQYGVDEILQRRSELQNVNPALKKKLATVQKEFHDLAEQNKKALQRMSEGITKLSDKIRNAAMETAKKKRIVNYSETGEIRDQRSPVVTTGVSETA